MIWTYSIHRWLHTSRLLGFRTDLGVLILCAVLFAGSRDALAKYRNRSRELAGQVALNDSKGEAMTNGIDHNQGNGGKAQKPSPPKPDAKPETPAKPQSVAASRKQSK